jgi:hypothetical protein
MQICNCLCQRRRLQYSLKHIHYSLPSSSCVLNYYQLSISLKTHMQPIINHNLLCIQCPNKHQSSCWCHGWTKNNEEREIPGTNGMCVQTCTNEIGYWLTVFTLKQRSDKIPEALVSPVIFPVNMKLWIFPFTTWHVADMFRQMESLHY